MTSALARLGEIAAEQGIPVRLVLVGGGAMVLGFDARLSTRDLDVAILEPADQTIVRRFAKQVADEVNWPETWLNDAAKGFLIGLSPGPVLFTSNGIEVIRPSTGEEKGRRKGVSVRRQSR